jgi:hypothetical protein
MSVTAASPSTVTRPVAIDIRAAKLAVNGGTPVSATAVPFMATGLSEADIAAATAVLRSGMLRAAKKSWKPGWPR